MRTDGENSFNFVKTPDDYIQKRADNEAENDNDNVIEKNCVHSYKSKLKSQNAKLKLLILKLFILKGNNTCA